MAYKYIGDSDLAHGGMFIDIPDSFDQDYAEVVKVSDLEGAIGYEGAFMIESGSIYMGAGMFERAASCVGAKLLPDGSIDDNGRILTPDTLEHWLCQAYAIDAYIGIDDATVETVAFDTDTADSFDGWTLDEREPDSSIDDYIEKRHGYTIADAE